MNRPLPDVIADILSYHGAIVDKEDNSYFDVIVPPDVSDILNIPEYARLTFSNGETSDEAVYASYDSEFFVSIRNLFANRGKFTIAHYETYFHIWEKISRLLSENIAFGNATYRLEKNEIKDITYLLIYFKYTAVSDEKNEGILPVLINSMNLSVAPFENSINDIAERLKEVDFTQGHPKHVSLKILQSAYTACTGMIQARLKDFKKSLEKRLKRDIKRVYEYYETLKTESRTVIERKLTASEKQDNIELLTRKLDAIVAEQKWKIQDLISKYALSIKVEPVAILSIETNAPIFWINIKRRLASRLFPVTYNPIIKQMDSLPCESCFNPTEGYFICDDHLHIVCGKCLKTCPNCSKKYCMACHTKLCPKCKRNG